MIRRESFQPLPDRAPYFWIETPIGRLCFARRPPSLTRSWGMEIRTQQSRAVDLYKEAAETEDADIAGQAQAIYEASLGLYIVRHWVDEEHTMECRRAYRSGALHPSKDWDEHFPDLRETMLRYGWLAACEMAEWDMTTDDMNALVAAIASGDKSAMPDPEDVEEAADFCEPPMVSGTCA